MRVTVPSILAVHILWLLLGTSIFAQKRYIPAPLRVAVPLESTWEAALQTLGNQELAILTSDRVRGTITSEFKEYISGPLTESHIAKVGEKPKLTDGDWTRVEYQYEVGIMFIEEKDTLVSVNANIRALKRSFLGEDEWVEIPSTGKLEENLLTAFGRQLFGSSFNLETPKKGYWDRSPEYIQDADILPRVVGPERRP